MKRILLKLLSALLAWMMVFGAVAAIVSASLPVYADGEDDTTPGGEEGENEEEKGETKFKASDLETIMYASEEDKLLTMTKQTPILDAEGNPVLDANGNPTCVHEPWIKKGDYELYVQEVTGEVAVRNVKTGQVLFTNPYDLRKNISALSTVQPMFSQLAIKYQTIKDGKTATMNSYIDSALRDQITVSYIKNGVCVEYTMGRADERRLVPFWMEKYRFEKLILEKIGEKEYAYTKMKSYYMLVDMSDTTLPKETVARYEDRYKCLATWNASTANKTWTSEGYDESKESEYAADRTAGKIAVPYKGRMSIYVLAEDQTTNYEKNKIEEYIRTYNPEYNYDTLAYDHELTGFVGKKTTLPVFKLALEYRVDADGFIVRLPANSITFDEEYFRLLSVDVLPYMGAGSADYTGYTFVPDGSGTLIRFEDVKDSQFVFNTGTMYGPDFAYHTLPVEFTGQAEVMRYPVFGLVEDTVKYYELKTEAAYREICPHRFVKRTVEPDCGNEADGYTYYYCAICGLKGEVTEVSKWKHTFTGTATPNPKGNCQQAEVLTRVCTTCKKTIVTETPMPDAHNFGEYYEYDTENHVCYAVQRCDNAKIGEDGKPLTDEDGNVITCGAIGSKIPIDHDFEGQETVTVRKDGKCCTTVTCKNCGFVLEEEIDHNFVSTVHTDEDGLCVIKKTCECGYVELTKTKHTKAEGTEKPVYDTAKHICLLEYECAECGKTVSEELEHEFENGVCKNCGFTVPSPEEVGGHHLQVGYKEVGGVCYRTLICTDEGCSYEHAAARAAVPHKFVDSRFVSPTCTENGYRIWTCEHCSYRTGRTEVDPSEGGVTALGHSFVWTKDQKTSCLEGYVSEHRCTTCGYVDETKTIPAEGHIYDETMILQESEHGPGVYKHECSFCHHVYYETRAYVPAEEKTPADAGAQSAPEGPAATGSYPGAEGDEEDGEDGESGEDGEDGEGDDDVPVVIDKDAVKFTVTHGYVAVVTAGSSLASLSSVHGGAKHKYNYVYLSVNPRPQDSYNLRDAISTGADANWTVVSERKYNGSYRIKYYMLQTVEDGLEGKIEQSDVHSAQASVYGNSTYKADYTGMAAAYRDYLTDEGVLKPLEQRDDGIPMYLEAFGAITINSTFLTVPIKEKKALNTFSDLKNIVDHLKEVKGEDGKTYNITNVNLRLTGFANNGMNYNVPYKVKFEKVVGGDKGFTEFVEYAKQNNVGVYPDFDFAYMKHAAAFDGYSNSKHAVKTIDSRYIVKKTYNSTLQIFTNTGLQAISASVYEHFYNTFNKNYSKFGNMGISVSTLGTDLNSDFDKKEPYNREDSREFTERILKKMQADYGSVMIDGGNAYTLPYVNHILNMSLSGSNYLLTSESVPFMSMVIHGSVNYAGKATNMASSLDVEILNIIENGASPYFLIATENTSYMKEIPSLSDYYSLDYSTWERDIIETYITLNEALKDVQYAHFVDHRFVTAERIPDRDEIDADYLDAVKKISAAITKYLDAEKRAENAKNLYERKSVTELDAYREELLAILSKYGFASAEDSKMESMDVVLSEEDERKINALKMKIDNCLIVAQDQKIIDNVAQTAADFEKATAAFEKEMAQYEFMFNVPDSRRLDVSAYTERDGYGNLRYYKGAIYRNEAGEYVVAVDGRTDTAGNPLTSNYTIGDKSVVKVGYDNGVEFYLNYNYFNVIVKVDGKNVVIPAYSFYKKV